MSTRLSKHRAAAAQSWNLIQSSARSLAFLSVAFEMLCIALRTGECDDGVKQAVPTKLIALAKAGERNPDILCEEVLKDIRRPQQ